MMDTSKVTRFEIIDQHGRCHTEYVDNLTVDLQDDGRTLKVFFTMDDDQSGAEAHIKALTEYFRNL